MVESPETCAGISGNRLERQLIFSRDRKGPDVDAAPDDRWQPGERLFRRAMRRLGSADPTPAGGRLPRFSISATDELGDVKPVPGRLVPERVRLALAEALAASQPVTSRERFAGRADVLEALITAIEQQRAHVVLYGERGIGKTSLVHVLAETAREARYLVGYGSCGVEARFDEMFRAFAAGIPLLFHAGVSPTADEAEHDRSFADLIGDGPVDPRELAELFARIVGTRVLLILDEYDRVGDPGFRRNVAELIKNLSDRAARVQLVLTGVASNLDELVGFTPSIRRNIVGLAVGPMSDGEVAEILDRAEAATGLRFTAEARALLFRMAAGSPYLVRLLGTRAALVALEAERGTIEPPDVLEGAEAVLKEWNAGLPRHAQRLLQRPEVKAAIPLLIAAARASGTPDGAFLAEDVAGEADPGPVRAQLERLSGSIDLFEMLPGDPEPRFRFRTPGLAQLLTLSAALARSAG